MAFRFPSIFPHFESITARLPKSVAQSNLLLTPDIRASLPAAFLHQLQAALAQSLFWVYGLTFALAVIGLAAMFFFPGGRADKYTYKSVQEKAAAGGATDDTDAGAHEPARSLIDMA